ncbi:MAG: FAD/NAD(P)-binding oxidoreductase [Bacteroidota bacterium]
MHVVIIGNGISGTTAARFIRKLSDHKITVISSEHDYFFSRTALMYVYMGHMRFKDTQPYENWFWEKNRIELKKAHVNNIDYNAKSLSFTGGGNMQYDKLILALGSEPNKFGWPGQDLNKVHGLYTKQDLEAMEKHSVGLQRAVIVGGGLIGLEMAEMFHSRHIPVTFLVREASYWNMVMPPEESAMIGRHIIEHGIDIRFSTELKEIIDDGNGNACGVITNKEEKIDCGYVGLTAGVHPNVNFLRESGLEIQKGIVVNDYLETNMPDVYAIGDCAQIENPQPGRRPIEAVWYTGKMMGETVAYTICKQKLAYDPGIWFNSAKFLDIEYQVYGTILAKPPEHHQSLYWEAADGKKSIRIVYDRNDNSILGFNLMGVRYRHEVCEKWIQNKASIDEVMQNLSLANFDPELYKAYEADVVAQYNQQSGKSIQLKKSRSWNNVFSFLNS